MGAFAFCILAILLLLLFYWNVQVFSERFQFQRYLFSHSSKNASLLNALFVWEYERRI